MTDSSPRERFEALVAEYDAAVARLCRGYERDDARAEELRQEIWLGLWRAWPSFRHEASLRTWLFRVAHNVASSHVRKRVRDRARPTPPHDVVADGAPDSSQRPDRHISDAQRLEQLRAAIHRLRPLDRQLVLLYLEELPQDEIGHVTGLSRENVSTRIGRIKQRLAEAIRRQETSP